ncbi:flavin reductase family protein [Diaphorobacter sp. HDW4A]|uniref:flavin reductase family protein n=1 Tax=Diaphorobacter sp. HDW4A TaxID=2714924 RepID=UPI0014093757|nr:flavin reductase family protein [Diaphorobacter sp. HDW4A]QIL80783.1 flavin reductase family protein [Diaphorobacter sp. HDW4A]
MLHEQEIKNRAWRHRHEIAEAPADFRKALGCFATGVTVVTTVDSEGNRVGLTANSFTSVSMNPPLVLWSLSRRSPNLSAFETCDHFAINVLANTQRHICTQFSRPVEDRFAGVEAIEGAGGVPMIAGAVAHFECEKEAVHSGGDHIIFVGRVSRFRWHERTPLVFCMGALHELELSQDK